MLVNVSRPLKRSQVCAPPVWLLRVSDVFSLGLCYSFFFNMLFIILPWNRNQLLARVRGRDCEKEGDGRKWQQGAWGGHTVEISAQRYRSNCYQQPSAEKSHSDQNI